MASQNRKYAVPVYAQCPMCIRAVTSVKSLACSHVLCERCLGKIIQDTLPPFCPECKKSVDKTQTFESHFFHCIECFQCLKVKKPQEFFWCSVCVKMLCSSCLPQGNHFLENHTLYKWNTLDAIKSCLRSTYQRSFEGLKAERSLRDLIEPILQSVLKQVRTKFHSAEDSIKSLHLAAGVPIPTNIEREYLGMDIANPEAFNFLNSLLELSLEQREDELKKFNNLSIMDESKIAAAISEELQFDQNKTSAAVTQDGEIEDVNDVLGGPEIRIHGNGRIAIRGTIFIVSDIDPYRNFIRENNLGAIKIRTGFGDESVLSIRNGLRSSFAFFDEQTIRFIWRDEEFKPIRVALNQQAFPSQKPACKVWDFPWLPRIDSVALDDSKSRAYILVRKFSPKASSVHIFDFKTSEEVDTIRLNESMEEREPTSFGQIFCAKGGVPFLFLNVRRSDQAIVQEACAAYIFEVNTEKPKITASVIHKLEGVVAADIAAIELEASTKKKFLIVACNNRMEILSCSSHSKQVQNIQSIPIDGHKSCIMAMPGNAEFGFISMNGITVYSYDSLEEIFRVKFISHDPLFSKCNDYISQKGKLYRDLPSQRYTYLTPYSLDSSIDHLLCPENNNSV